MIKVDVSDEVFIPFPQAKKSDLIITNHPTQKDLVRAEEFGKMILVFLPQPNDLDLSDIVVRRAYLTGLNNGWGIEVSPYLLVVVVPSPLDIESVIHAYVDEWLRCQQSQNVLGMNPHDCIAVPDVFSSFSDDGLNTFCKFDLPGVEFLDE